MQTFIANPVFSLEVPCFWLDFAVVSDRLYHLLDVYILPDNTLPKTNMTGYHSKDVFLILEMVIFQPDM